VQINKEVKMQNIFGTFLEPQGTQIGCLSSIWSINHIRELLQISILWRRMKVGGFTNGCIFRWLDQWMTFGSLWLKEHKRKSFK